ncbi:REJ domain-containing protein [Fimicolochytrium jonesii]|uniref:REJ domain-containing protein n=1 Tax=Fimicolochytrium jonesii TaxID=1396493 RepID=UPI0022FDC188|nr:REJ domain-containing protein [Fimicolochytrium jonesii]KAI8822714.1 REJ domain-containing protein [Fimicolochytrium jonesii]
MQTAKPGVVVRHNGHSIQVHGNLYASGTSGSRISFIGASAAPTSMTGAQAGITTFQDHALPVITLNYVDISNFEFAIENRGSMQITQSNFTNNLKGVSSWTEHLISTTVFQNNAHAASGDHGHVDNCTFVSNQIGVESLFYDNMYLTNNIFDGNTVAALSDVQGQCDGNVFVNNLVAVSVSHSNPDGLTLSNNLFSNNSVDISVSGANPPVVHGNAFCGSPTWHVQMGTDADFDATGNYWGTSDGAIVRGYLNDAYWDSNLGFVSVVPFLTAMPASVYGIDIYYCDPPADKNFTRLTTGGVYEDTNITVADSPYVISERLVIFATATLTIEPGVNITVNGAGALVVRGSLQANGTADDPIIWQGWYADERLRIGIVTDGGTVYASFVTFAGFAKVFDYKNSAGSHPYIFEDCTFLDNDVGIQVSGSIVTRCNFTSNGHAVIGDRITVTNSTFVQNDVVTYGLNAFTYQLTGSSFAQSTFFNNSLVADTGLMRFTDCLFVGNDQVSKNSPSSFTNSLFVENANLFLVGSETGLQMSGCSICGTKEWNVRLSTSTDVTIPGNYWGSNNLTLIRNTVYDAYQAAGPGIAKLDPVLDAPMATFGADMYPYCAPPDDRGVDPANTPSILEDRIIGVDQSPWVVNSVLVVYPGVTLIIQAGVTVQMGLDFQLVNRGTLVVNGTADARVVFEGNALQPVQCGDLHLSTPAMLTMDFASFNGSVTPITVVGGSQMALSNVEFRNGSEAINGACGKCSLDSSLIDGVEGKNIVITNTTFTNNNQALYSMQYATVSDSTFSQNNIGLYGVHGSITNNIILNNTIGVQSGDVIATYSGNTIVGNEVGLQVESNYQFTFTGNNLCGNKLNVNHRSPITLDLSQNWFGIEDAGQAAASFSDHRTNKDIQGRITLNLGVRWFPVEGSPVDSCVSPPLCLPTTCSGHGIRNAFSGCDCLANWSGDKCDICTGILVGSRCVTPAAAISNDCNACLAVPTYAWCISNSSCIDATQSNATCELVSTDAGKCGNDNSVIVSTATMSSFSTINVLFRSATDQGASTLPFESFGSTFDCVWVLSFVTTQLLGKGTFCFFQSDRNLVIQIGSGDFRPFADKLQLKKSAIASANDSTILNSDQIFAIDPPAVLQRPEAKIRAPQSISSCDSLTVDAAASADISGTLVPIWSCSLPGIGACPDSVLYDMTAGDLTFTVSSKSLHSVTSMNSGLATTLRFELRLYNGFGICSPSSADITVLPGTALMVSIQGQPALPIMSRNPATIYAAANAPSCGSVRPSYAYQWTWDSTLISESITPSGSSLVVGSSAFGPPNNRLAGAWVNLTVQDQNGTFAPGQAALWIYPQTQPLQLLIDQDGAILSAFHDFGLSFVAFDPEGDPEAGAFVVQCQMSVDAGSTFQPCSGALSDIAVSASDDGVSLDNFRQKFTVLIPRPDPSFGPGLYNFKVFWVKGDRSAVGSAATTMTADSTLLPETRMDLLSPLPGRFIPSSVGVPYVTVSLSNITLQAYPFGPDYTYQWNITTSRSDDSLMANISASSTTGLSQPSLQIPVDALSAGTFYTITINVTQDTNSQRLVGSSAMTIFVVSPPYNGRVQVTPDSGMISTLFQFRVLEVIDFIGGLEYSFGYDNANGSTVQLSQGFSGDNIFSAYLPAASEDSPISIWCDVRNSFGFINRLAADVAVQLEELDPDSVANDLADTVQSPIVAASLLLSLSNTISSPDVGLQQEDIDTIAGAIATAAIDLATNLTDNVVSHESVASVANLLGAGLEASAASSAGPSTDVVDKALDSLQTLTESASILADSDAQQDFSDPVIAEPMPAETAGLLISVIDAAQNATLSLPDVLSPATDDSRLAEAVSNVLSAVSSGILVGQEPLVISSSNVIGIAMRDFGIMDVNFEADTATANDTTESSTTSLTTVTPTESVSASMSEASANVIPVTVSAAFPVMVNINLPTTVASATNSSAADGVIDTRVQMWAEAPIKDPSVNIGSQEINQ